MKSYTSQKMKIMNSEWKTLIILDACRYDYFEGSYNYYLNGELEKVISPATHTDEWRHRIFDKEFLNLVYVSANPRINSKVPVTGFNARNRFYRVIDVWDWGWDENLSTVPPEAVNRAALKAIAKYPSKKLVVHYMQPHAPYTPPISQSIKKLSEKEKQLIILLRRGGKRVLGIRLKKIGQFLIRLEDILNQERLRQGIFEKYGSLMPDPASVGYFLGDDFLRNVYKNNLRYVLKYVKRLVEISSRKTVVTADHGELLGERGEYDHPHDMHSVSELKVIPWLIIS